MKSRRNDGIYVVDTFIGRCQCLKGVNGSTCWHQFLLWSSGISSSPNFLPVNNPIEKQRMAHLAIGNSLSSNYYDSIHTSQNCFQQRKESFLPQDGNDSFTPTFVTANDIADDASSNGTDEANVLEKFDCFYNNVVSEIKQGDPEYQKSILKFMSRYEKFSLNQRKSAFQSFGSIFVGKAKGKMKVQPGSASRRKSKIRSRQKQDTATPKNLPHRRATTKRKHSMTHVIDENVPAAKKAGRHMVSNLKYPIRKKKNKKVKK